MLSIKPLLIYKFKSLTQGVTIGPWRCHVPREIAPVGARPRNTGKEAQKMHGKMMQCMALSDDCIGEVSHLCKDLFTPLNLRAGAENLTVNCRQKVRIVDKGAP